VELAERFEEEGLLLFTVSYDDSASHVERFFEEKGYAYPVVMDDRTEGVTGKPYQVGGLPTLFLIDREGNVVERRIGYDPEHADELTGAVEALVQG